MRFVNQHAARLIGGTLVLALSLSNCAVALPVPQDASSQRQDQQPPAGQPSTVPAASQPDAAQLPDSPGAGQPRTADQPEAGKPDSAKPDTGKPDNDPAPAGQAGKNDVDNVDNKDLGTPASAPPQSQPDGKTKPVGTAAAETANTMGFAVARPAGVAMAPAKQKRVRTIVISVAAIVGAGIAIGTVAALSKGTPSKPPGAQ